MDTLWILLIQIIQIYNMHKELTLKKIVMMII